MENARWGGVRIEARPLARRHMPADYAISLASYTGRGTPNEKRIPDDFGPPQPMRGFEETCRNVIDDTVRIACRSHRTLIRGTNDRDGRCRPATNRNLDVPGIADRVSLPR